MFDRDQEWADLADFAAPVLPGLRIAVVYGRRQGNSHLLRRLAEASGGLYHLATEQIEAISVRRFADALAARQGLPAGTFGFDWFWFRPDDADPVKASLSGYGRSGRRDDAWTAGPVMMGVGWCGG